MAAKGVTAFAFSENPEPLGLPTIHDADRYWDPVMAAANELEMVVCMHVGSSSTMPQIAKDAPFMANLTWGAIRTSGTMLAWLFSGLFQRFPNLKIALSEGEVGWIPYFLERAEQVLDKQRYWVLRGQKFAGPRDDGRRPRPARHPELVPRSRLRLLHRGPPRHCQPRRDRRGQRDVRDGLPALRLDLAGLHRHGQGVDQDLPPEMQYKLLRGNAERLYRFTPAEPPTANTDRRLR